MRIPKRTTTPYTCLQYSFPEPRPIYWGPDQYILEDFAYVPPENWQPNVILAIPKVVRFIHDSGPADTGEGGEGEFLYSECVIYFTFTSCVGGLNAANGVQPYAPNTPPSNGYFSLLTAAFDAIDPDTFGVSLGVLFECARYKVAHFGNTINLFNCDGSEFGVTQDTISWEEYVSRGYLTNPIAYTTYYFTDHIENVETAGYDCDPLDLEP